MNTVKRRKPLRLGTVMRYLVLVAFAIMCIFPFAWVCLNSIKTDNEVYGNPFGLPEKVIFSNYASAWNGARIELNLLNSLIYSFGSVTVLLLCSSMASYVIARVLKAKWIYNFFTLGMMVPVHAIIIPLLIFLRKLHLVNSFPGLIISYAAASLSFSIFILVSFMKTLPVEIEEAAFIDGCSRPRLFFSIIFPLSKAGLATIGTFAFIDSWNDLLLAMVINSSPHLRSLNLACYNLRGMYVQKYGLINAGLVTLIIPVVIIYILFQEQIVKGMTAGAVKG